MAGESLKHNIPNLYAPSPFYSSLKTAENLEVVKQLPADKLLIETGTLQQDIDIAMASSQTSQHVHITLKSWKGLGINCKLHMQRFYFLQKKYIFD